jgi:AmmeMemoRadiSam system protein B
MPETTLMPAVAGRWYPKEREALAGLVDSLLDDARARRAETFAATSAVIAPHAGFAYSGAVAAAAFAPLADRRFDRIVLIGPSHYFGFSGAAVPEKDAAMYRTPLGDVPIDRDAVAVLARSAGFQSSDKLFEPEHALESELPFLQRVLPTVVPVVPILMGGGASADDAARVAEAIDALRAASTLVVVSSDFTHFGPRFGYVPFTDDVPRRVRELDLAAVAAVEAGDAAAFASLVRTTGATICGHRAIEVLLKLSSPGLAGRLAEYDTSGRMTGAWDHSVSYASIAVTG